MPSKDKKMQQHLDADEKRETYIVSRRTKVDVIDHVHFNIQ